MDPTKAPHDKFYKYCASLGLTGMLGIIGFAIWYWNSTQNTLLDLKKEQSVLKSDLKKYDDLRLNWHGAVELKDRVVNDLALKKNYVASDPYSDEKIEQTKTDLAKLQAVADEQVRTKGRASLHVADPEKTVALMKSMRDYFEAMPSLEDLELALTAVNKRILFFEAQAKDIQDLKYRIDLKQGEIENSEERYVLQSNILTAIKVASAFGVLITGFISSYGFWTWYNKEMISNDETKTKLFIPE